MGRHDEARRQLKNYTMAGIARNIVCPTLITHGDKDTLMAIDGARRLFAEIGASCARANHRLPGHAHDRHVARDERLSAAGAAFDENEIGIGAVAFEQAFVLGHPQGNLVGAEGRVTQEKLSLGETRRMKK